MDAQGNAQTFPDELENVNDLITKYKEKLKSDPNNLTILSNLGVCFASINDFDEADKFFTKILELDQKNLDALNNLGVIYTQTGKLNEAIEKLEIAVKLKPDSIKYWSNLSEVYRRAGNYHKSNVCRMRAIQLTEK